MLLQLQIQNYAIIDQMEIGIPPGLSIITGETGAGKSIIIGALGLILGERADSRVLLNRDRKCVVEGVFSWKDDRGVEQFLLKSDLDQPEELVLRREIGTNGKSRAFINDTPVTLAQLQELSNLLVDLHQQFDTLQLGQSAFQRNVLDALAGLQQDVGIYDEAYQQWVIARTEWQKLVLEKSEFEKELDYIRFQYQELKDAALGRGELEELEAELKLQSNAEGIKAALQKTIYELSDSDEPVVQRIRILVHQLQPWIDYHPELSDLIARMDSLQIELRDLSGEAGHINNRIQYDAERIALISDRLSLGYKLQKKHGVKSTSELLDIQTGLENKLKAVLDIDEAIIAKERTSNQFLEKAKAIAQKLSTGRKKTIEPFTKKVNELLVRVGMPNARLKVRMQTQEALSTSGYDIIEFLFDANKSDQFLPVGKVASGGELSRLMLCIKSLVAHAMDLPTMIFDEIDTGISGEAARQVGMIMKELAQNRQVISITHQPQIAGRADTHFFVFKEIAGDAVRTGIRQLNQDERIITIAKMLSGEKPTTAAIENAREMVMN